MYIFEEILNKLVYHFRLSWISLNYIFMIFLNRSYRESFTQLSHAQTRKFSGALFNIFLYKTLRCSCTYIFIQNYIID